MVSDGLERWQLEDVGPFWLEHRKKPRVIGPCGSPHKNPCQECEAGYRCQFAHVQEKRLEEARAVMREKVEREIMQDCELCQGGGQVVHACPHCLGNGVERGQAGELLGQDGNLDALEVLRKAESMSLPQRKVVELIHLARLLIQAERQSMDDHLEEIERKHIEALEQRAKAHVAETKELEAMVAQQKAELLRRPPALLRQPVTIQVDKPVFTKPGVLGAEFEALKRALKQEG